LTKNFPKRRWIDFRLNLQNAMTAKNKISDFRKELVSGFWKYQQKYFKDWENYFERPISTDGRPPVFLKHMAHHNKEKRGKLLFCFQVGRRVSAKCLPGSANIPFPGWRW